MGDMQITEEGLKLHEGRQKKRGRNDSKGILESG